MVADQLRGKIQVELQEFMGSDASIANAAWTSTYDKDKRDEKYDDPEKVASLVPRLVKDGHSVPIESVIFRFWIRMPIFIDREHMTHRIASHNGLSGRYRTMPDDYYGIPEDVMDALAKINPEDGIFANKIYMDYSSLCEKANDFYRGMLELSKQAEKDGKITNGEFKRIRETIRGPLPIAGMVERTSILNLRSFANYYRLRSAPFAAKEIQTIANLKLKRIEEANICPLAIAALKEAGWRV